VNIKYKLKLQYDKITIKITMEYFKIGTRIFVATCSIDFIRREVDV
jgi:hypothetical protein